MLNKTDQYYIWDKTDSLPLNQYFNTKEFTCQCNYSTCQEQRISIDLVDKLTQLRVIVGPLNITSGFRCPEHQKELKESGVNTVVATKSQHELGNAADVKPAKVSIADFLVEAEKIFFAIGVAKTFLHLDTRPKKADGTSRRWVY